MKILCENIFNEDENFADFKTGFDSCYYSLKCIVDDIKKDTDKANKELTNNNNQFELIQKVDPDIEDLPFGKQIKIFLV